MATPPLSFSSGGLDGDKKERATNYRNDKAYSGHCHMGSGRRLACVLFEPIERFADVWKCQFLALRFLPLKLLLFVDALIEFFAARLGAVFAVHSGVFLDAPNRRLAPPALVVTLYLQFVAVSLCASAADSACIFLKVDAACVLSN
jgi:hypothetical protein